MEFLHQIGQRRNLPEKRDTFMSRARKAKGGEGYSGSTAWHNSAPSCLLMSRAENGAVTLEYQQVEPRFPR